MIEVNQPLPTNELVRPENESNHPTIDRVYSQLTQLEQLSPDPEDLIGVSISPDDIEYPRLQQASVTDEEMRAGKIPRKKLLEAGYIFNNRPLRGMEKPLIFAVIEDVDYGKRTLLTPADMLKIERYQRERPEQYGSDDIGSEGFRKDVLSLLLGNQVELPSHISNKVNAYRLGINYLELPHNYKYESYSKKELATNALYLRLFQLFYQDFLRKKSSHMPDILTHPYIAEKFFVREYFSDEMPWEEEDRNGYTHPLKIRGHKGKSFDSRKMKLNGAYSPFLDSGFRFPSQIGNPDYDIMWHDESGKSGRFRVNMMVWHLLSRKLSEMGDGTEKLNVTGTGEQDYAIGNYISAFENGDKELFHRLEERTFQLSQSFDSQLFLKQLIEKIKELVKDWAAQSEDENAKKLLEDLVRLENGGGRYGKIRDLIRKIRKRGNV